MRSSIFGASTLLGFSVLGDGRAGLVGIAGFAKPSDLSFGGSLGPMIPSFGFGSGGFDLLDLESDGVTGGVDCTGFFATGVVSDSTGAAGLETD